MYASVCMYVSMPLCVCKMREAQKKNWEEKPTKRGSEREREKEETGVWVREREKPTKRGEGERKRKKKEKETLTELKMKSGLLLSARASRSPRPPDYVPMT